MEGDCSNFPLIRHDYGIRQYLSHANVGWIVPEVDLQCLLSIHPLVRQKAYRQVRYLLDLLRKFGQNGCEHHQTK